MQSNAARSTGRRDDRIRVKLRGPADIVAAVPFLIGFHPRQSVVAVALSGPRLEVCFTMRIDAGCLPDDAMAEDIAVRVAFAGGEHALLVLYDPPTSADGSTPGEALVAVVNRELTERQIELREAIRVSDGRWWSYFCAEPTCCPVTGTPIVHDGQTSEVAAAAAFAGVAPLPDRDALVQSIAAPVGATAAAMAVALDRAADGLLVGYAAGEREGVRRETRDLFASALERYTNPPASLTDDEAARLIVGLADLSVRDEIACQGATRSGEPLVALLTDLARRALPPVDVATLSVLGWVAYAQGCGVLAAIAVERALASDPSYRLARLLSDALDRQVPPERLRQASRDSSRARRSGPGRPATRRRRKPG